MLLPPDPAPEAGHPRLDLFLSHCSDDAIAKELFKVISTFVYSGDDALVAQRVFFTSEGHVGLRAGEHFGAMLTRLQQASTVLVLITERTRQSVAVHAEMAYAHHLGKFLPVVARKDYNAFLTWPFAEVQTRALDTPADTMDLLRSLAHHADRTLAAGAERACADLARAARKHHRPPPDAAWRLRLLTGVALAALVVVALGGFAIGKRFVPESTVTVGSTPVAFESDRIQVVFEGTFPTKRLSSRLNEIYRRLRRGAGADGTGDEAVRQQVHDVFRQAIALAKADFGLTDETEQALKDVVGRWHGGDSGLDAAGGRACTELPVPLDREWCALIDTLAENRRGLLDDTKFSVLRAESETPGTAARYTALVPGKEVEGHAGWVVGDLEAVTLRRKGQ
ncbi:MAG: hypothetical protein AB7O28_09745 [Vicinamibacterales bacterium]